MLQVEWLDVCDKLRMCWLEDLLEIMILWVLQPLLYEPTKQAIAALLPKSANGNLADLCTWPDEVRWMDKYKWTRELHWVNTPNHVCKYDYNRESATPIQITYNYAILFQSEGCGRCSFLFMFWCRSGNRGYDLWSSVSTS